MNLKQSHQDSFYSDNGSTQTTPRRSKSNDNLNLRNSGLFPNNKSNLNNRNVSGSAPHLNNPNDSLNSSRNRSQLDTRTLTDDSDED